MPRRLALVFPVASALFTILAFPNWNQAWLAWIALVPLAFITQFSTPRESFFYGWLSGALAYSGLLSWLVDTFYAAHLSLPLAIFCLFALSAYLGLFWGVWAYALKYLALKPLKCLALYGAAGWVALEYLRTHLFSGFPWTLWADSQMANLSLIQIASFTGVYGVSFLAVLINVAIASGRWRAILQAFVLLLAVYGYGFWTLQQSEETPSRPVSVALLQGNIDQYKKWDAEYVRDIQNTYAALVGQAAAAHAELIIWPETSVPGYLLQSPTLRLWLESVVRDSKTWHIVGSPVQHDEKSYNSAFSLNPKGQIEGEYAKMHLVPFGEIVPWGNILGRWISVLNELGGFTAGEQSPVLRCAWYSTGINICYEAIFPDLVRRSVKAGAEVIINITNDGWYMKTAAPYQHLAPNVFRAVENHRWLLRANNTGVSAIIDPEGRIVAASNIYEPAVVTGLFMPLSDKTFYTRFGDVFSWACCLIVIGVLAYRKANCKKQKGPI